MVPGGKLQHIYAMNLESKLIRMSAHHLVIRRFICKLTLPYSNEMEVFDLPEGPEYNKIESSAKRMDLFELTNCNWYYF